MRINIRYLSLIVFVLPLFTVVISYIVSVRLNLVSFCIPNLDGCTSISRVGRYEPVKYFLNHLCIYLVYSFYFIGGKIF